MAPKQSSKPAKRGHSSSLSVKDDPKASPDYYVKPIFKEPSKLYGRERELRLLKAAFRRLVDDSDVDDAEKEAQLNRSGAVDVDLDVKDGDDSCPTNPIDVIDPSGSSKSSDDTKSSADYLFVHRDSLADATTARKKETKTHARPTGQHIRHSIKQKSDISLKHESTLLCHAPQTRECIFLYGPQGMGKRSLVKYALEELVNERGGWFICGEFERDYFDRGGGRSRRSIERGKSTRGVRFEDEKSNDDDEFSSTSGLPLSGFIAVCREICAKLLDIRGAQGQVYDERSRRSSVMFNLSHKFDETVEKCIQSLSLEERQLLIKSLGLPELKPILGLESDNKSDYYEPKIENVLHHKKKLHYAFQKFISVISHIHGPLVICFSNFQFADDASLDLLESVLFDREIGMMMVIGCIQLADQAITTNDESVPISERMSKKMNTKMEQWRQADIEKFGLQITVIELNNLSLESTKEILIDMLSIENKRSSIKETFANMFSRKDDITSIAQLCYEYTHGNTYFLKRFIEILHKKKLLFMDHGSEKWCWDLYDVASVITMTNVVDVIVSESVNKLPKQAKSLLLLAACMGSTYIDEELLYCLWNKFERKARSKVDSQSQFRLFVNESLYRKVLVKVEDSAAAGIRAYHWAHESMIKALSDHVDSHNISNLRYEIGTTLEHNLAEKSDVLVVAKLVNSGGNSLLGSLDSNTRVRWAKKNLIAAKRAVLMSAFDRAAQYAEASIEYLPSSMRWKEHCNLMLELSSILGEVAGAIGNSRLMERYCEEIICRHELKMSDKIRAYVTLMENLATYDHQKAVSLCLTVLKKLDCAFKEDAVARDTESFTSCIEETKALKRGELLDKIEQLPRMDDRERMDCVKLLCRLCHFYIRKSKPAFTMAISRAARWTYHYGLTPESPIMFAYLGLACVTKQEFRVGAMHGEAALSLIDKTNNQWVKVQAHYIIWYMVMPWSHHVRDSSCPLVAAYHHGLQSGDIESAMKCLFAKLIIDLISGRSLLLIERTCQNVVPLMEHEGIKEVALLTRALWQTVLKLTGDDDETEDSILLDGKAFSETDFLRDPDASPYIKLYLGALKSYVCLFTGQYTKGAELALMRGNAFIDDVPGAALGLVDLVGRGIPMISVMKSSKKRSYTKELNEIRQLSKTWSSKGVCSRIHLELLLEAEHFALDGKCDEASDAFKKGIIIASRSGFVQDVALINDRYASFLLSNNLDKKKAEYHSNTAKAAYERWGRKNLDKLNNDADSDLQSSTTSSTKKMTLHSFGKKSSQNSRT